MGGRREELVTGQRGREREGGHTGHWEELKGQCSWRWDHCWRGGGAEDRSSLGLAVTSEGF